MTISEWQIEIVVFGYIFIVFFGMICADLYDHIIRNRNRRLNAIARMREIQLHQLPRINIGQYFPPRV